jgi:hypothetical protein
VDHSEALSMYERTVGDYFARRDVLAQRDLLKEVVLELETSDDKNDELLKIVKPRF